MEAKSAKTYTVFKTGVIDPDEATAMFIYLSTEIKWDEGIRSRKGPTRLGKSIDLEEHPEILRMIVTALSTVQPDMKEAGIFGAYLNYYRDGDMWTPNHSHKGTAQLVISLGATRTLQVGKKEYPMSNGSAIMFGSAIHGVPKEPLVAEGRISIAVFIAK